MTVLLGLLLLLSLAAIGRDSRILPFHGTCAAACVSGIGHGGSALAALILLLVLNGAGWIILRRYAVYRPGDARERRLGQQGAMLAACGAIALVLLTALAAMPGLQMLTCIGMVLCGLCGACLPVALLQLTGLLVALNGLVLLGSYGGSWPLVLGASLVWAGLLVLSVFLLPRLAWLRPDRPSSDGPTDV